MKRPFTLLFFLAPFICFAEDIIVLPPVTTYFDSIITEHKITFTREEIEQLHVESISELLSSAGIQLLSYGPYGLDQKPSIRGFTDETVRVVIDGLCVNNPQYGTFDFTTLNIQDIEKIEIVKGGFSEDVNDDGAVGGVIKITTKKNNWGQTLLGDLSTKTFFNPDLPFDTFSGNLNYRGQTSPNSFVQAALKGTFANNAYPYPDSESYQKVIRKNAEVQDGNLDVKFTCYFGNGSNFSLSELFYTGNKNTPGKEYGISGNQKDLNNKFTFSLINPAIKNLFRLENNLGWFYDYRTYQESSSNSKHILNTLKYCGTLDLLSPFQIKSIKIDPKLGINGEFFYLDSTDDGKHTKPGIAICQTTKAEFSRHISLSLPLNFKFSGENFAFTPKIAVRFNFYDFAFILNGYCITQFPNMDDLYWNGAGATGNPDLKPENGYGGELNFIWENKILPLSITAYTTYYENKIKWSNQSGSWRPENVASAFYAGIDADLSGSFFNDFLILKASGEYLYTRLLNKSDEQSYGKQIMWTPDFTGSLNASFNFEYLSANLNISYVGRRYNSNMNITYLKPYVLVNVSAQCTKWNFAKPYIKIENLLNWNYQAVEDYPMPGISLTAGCSFCWKK